MGLIVLGIEGDDRLHRLDRFRKFLGLAVKRAQKAHRFLCDRCAFAAPAWTARWLFGSLPCDRKDRRPARASIDVKLAFFRDALESFQRLIVGFQLDIGRAEIVARPIVIRIAGQNQIEFRRSPLEIAFFKRDQADFDPRLARIGFRCLRSVSNWRSASSSLFWPT